MGRVEEWKYGFAGVGGCWLVRERKNVFQMAKGYFTSIIDKAKDFMNSIKEAHYTRNRYNTPPLNREEAEKLVAN